MNHVLYDFFYRLLNFFQNQLFQKILFSNTIRVSNRLDPDQDQHSVGPDLGANCLQRLSTALARKELKIRQHYFTMELHQNVYILTGFKNAALTSFYIFQKTVECKLPLLQ